MTNKEWAEKLKAVIMLLESPHLPQEDKLRYVNELISIFKLFISQMENNKE